MRTRLTTFTLAGLFALAAVATGCGNNARGFQEGAGDSGRLGAQNKESQETKKLVSGPWCFVNARGQMERDWFKSAGGDFAQQLFTMTHEGKRGELISNLRGTWGLEGSKLMTRVGGESRIFFLTKHEDPELLPAKDASADSAADPVLMKRCN